MLDTVVDDAGRVETLGSLLQETLYHVHHTGLTDCVVKPRQKASAVHVASVGYGVAGCTIKSRREFLAVRSIMLDKMHLISSLR